MATPSKNNISSQLQSAPTTTTTAATNPTSLSLVVSTRHNQQKTYGGSINNLTTERNIASDFNSSENNLTTDQNKSSSKSNEQKLKKTNTKDDSDASSVAERTTISATEHIVRKFRQKFIILHYSPFKAVWDWIVLLLVVYTAVFTPFTVAFLLNEDEKRAKLNQHASTRLFKKQQSGADPFVIIDLIVDVMFLIDIFISFRTTFISKEGEAVYDPMIIAKNYLKGWFTIDAVAAMPYDLILFGSGNIDTLKVTGLLKTMRLLRLIRILPKLQKFSEYGVAMLLLLISAFALVGHWLACVFYAIAYIERPTLPEPKYSWLDHLAEKYNMPYHENNSESGPDLKSKYITALFFTLTSLTSVGFGNVSPTTNWEKIFSIIAMLLGSLISAAIFGNVTTIMMKMYQGTEELKEMQESVQDFIKFHGIPKTLSKRMQESFEHTWSYTNGIDMNMVLKSFPESLQADICLHLNRQLLNKCPAFQDASEGCMRMLALQFKSTHTPPGDTLIHKGDNLAAIFFIARGTLEIVKNGEVMAILDKNDIFGENIGKYQERDVMGRSSCDIRALSYCDLHKIERCDLLDVLEMYPDFAESFMKKFQVTFDLRECEMAEPKSCGKKLKRLKENLFKKSNKSLNQSTSTTPANENKTPGETGDSNPFLYAQQISALSSIKKSSMTDASMASPDSTNILSNSMASAQFNQALLNSADSNANIIPIDTTRKISSMLKKKSRMMRNTARLTPMIQSLNGKRNSSISNFSLTKRQISNMSEVELEIDHLLARVNKAEETLRNQMDMLTSFIFNYVTNEKPNNLNMH